MGTQVCKFASLGTVLVLAFSQVKFGQAWASLGTVLVLAFFKCSILISITRASLGTVLALALSQVQYSNQHNSYSFSANPLIMTGGQADGIMEND